ncbi:Reverse_transcriptase/endonuclease [Hexamita inflata]|uniref:Putative n=2 Tax=Hexamita inflata TaxID=28002 RepID=A0ABP1HJF9_9EUKA
MLNNNQNHFAPQNDDTQTDTTQNSVQDDTIWDVVKVDIQNAFNELPHDQIRQALENSAISLQDRRYIFNHLQSRWADDIPRVTQGVSTGDVISQKLFLACVDPILFELDEKGYRAVMYADDLTVLHKRGEYHQTVELLANMFQKIGLVINKDKCEGTDPSSGNTTGVIEFLGQNIGINSEPIAVQIQKQLQTRIKALQKYDIPKFYQYLIFKQCIIPSANYGPFLEASITETQLADAKDKYDYIDIMLAEAMEEILESDLPTKDLLDVMLLSKDDGGLDLITPGAYFDLMIQNRDMAFQDPTKVNKETRDFFSKNRHEFINSKQYPTNVKSEVKLGHCLDNFYQITNKGFQYLVDMRFNKKQKYVSLDTKCDLCNCKNDIYHELNCKKLQRNHILTHDYFVRQLADKMIDANKVREVKEVSKNNNNRTDQKHKADISFIKDGKQQFFDIGISWDTERYFAVKQKHYQTETVNGQPITCTPIIIGKDTTVHPESLAALRQVGIEDSWLYQQVGILMSNYREQTDYVFRKKTRKAQDQPTELNIQEIDQTEEFSSIPVNETTNSNAGTQNSSIKPKKKPRQKSQVQHSQQIQAQMNTQTQPPQVTHNTDNTQTNQGAINIQKQVVVNNFNCSNTSLSGQSKSQSTNKSEVARKSQNQQNPKQTAPKQVSQTKTPVQKPKEAPQAPLPQETKKTQSQIPLVKSKHTSEASSQSSTVSSGTQASECNITIEVEAQASELRRHWEDVDPKEYQEQVCCDLVEVIDIYVEDHPKSPISKIQSNLILILKAFYKRKLINRSQCEILLQKIKALQQVQNIEDVLKQASLPAQQENKQSQSEKKKAKKRQNQMDISIDDWV